MYHNIIRPISEEKTVEKVISEKPVVEKPLTSYGLRSLGHCKKTEPCADNVYCNCDCLQCNKQDCLRPGCGKDKGCKKIHPYKY